jgi:hypothetical protein
MKEVLRDGTDSPLKRLLLDISAVNYADPLSASALAASLEVCRTKLCDCCSPNTEPGDAKESDEPERWRCHPALRQFLCGTVAAHETGNGDGGSEAVLAVNVREH